MVFGNFFAVMIVALMLVVSSVFLIGLIAIPLLRAKKTGRLEWKIGKRSRVDGSEPSMGGAVMALGFAAWFFPTAFIADLKGSITQNSRGDLIFAGIYVIIIMCVGAIDDWLTKFRARPAGTPVLIRQLLIFSLSLTLLLLFSFSGTVNTAVLLPFRLGYVEMGILWYPVTAFVMTLCIGIFKQHFCFGSDYSTAVGGLSEFTGALALMTVGYCCEEIGAYCGGYLADFGAAACIGMLIFSSSPSKLWSGESGSMFIGALFAASVVMSGLWMLFIAAAVPQLADISVGAFHYLRFRRTPKARRADMSARRSLRMLWREKGFGDYTVMLLFGVLSLIGGVLSIMFAIYAGNLFLNL